MAGGGPHKQGGEAEYTTTHIARQGDPGSVLPHTPTGTVWKAGGLVNASWYMAFNHGGGCA